MNQEGPPTPPQPTSGLSWKIRCPLTTATSESRSVVTRPSGGAQGVWLSRRHSLAAVAPVGRVSLPPSPRAEECAPGQWNDASRTAGPGGEEVAGWGSPSHPASSSAAVRSVARSRAMARGWGRYHERTSGVAGSLSLRDGAGQRPVHDRQWPVNGPSTAQSGQHLGPGELAEQAPGHQQLGASYARAD